MKIFEVESRKRYVYRSMNWSEMLVELWRRCQLVFHPIAFSTSIQSLSNFKISKKTKTVSQLTSIRGRFGTSGHPRFLLKEMAIANNRYVSDDTMLTLIFGKNSHINQLHPEGRSYTANSTRTHRLKRSFHHLITMWNHANCHSGMSKTLKEIHYFFLIQGYEDIEPYIPSHSFSHQAVVLWSIINAARHFVAGILQDSQVWSKMLKIIPCQRFPRKQLPDVLLA